MRKYKLFIICLLAILCLDGCMGDKEKAAAVPQQSIKDVGDVDRDSDKAGKETSADRYEEQDNPENRWKKVYTEFLDNFPSKEDLKKNIFRFAIRDIDGDNVPELLLQKNGLIVTIYTCRSELVQIGRHNFQSGTTRFLVSDDSSCPGIFIFQVGGGYEWYSYMTVQGEKIVLEDLWNRDFSGISKILGKKRGKIEKTSFDEKLIAESKKVYKEDRDLSFQKILPRNYKNFSE